MQKLSGKKRNVLFIALIAFMLVMIPLVVKNFLTPYNIFNIITQASIYGTMAIGMTFVLITKGIDISLPAVMAAGSVIGVTYMKNTGDAITGCLIILVFTSLVGLVNGVAVTIFKMPSMIVTLAMQAVMQGFATWYTNYMTISGIPRPLVDFFRSSLWIVPVYVLVFLVIVVVCQFVLKKTLFGRWLYFTGTNVNTAEVSGVPTKFIGVMAYVFSGLSAGVAGIMLCTLMGSAQPGMGPSSMVLDIISSAVLGGVSLMGGIGTALGVASGAVFIAVISNVMNLLSIPFYLTQIAKGLIIILATAVDVYRKR